VLHLQLIALGLTAVALVVSGCGSSSKTDSTASVAAATTTTTATTAATTATTPPTITATTVAIAKGTPLTRTTLIAKGDAICAHSNKELSAISVTGEASFKRVLPQVAIYSNDESNELAKLVPPASLTSDWSTIINSIHLYSQYVDQIASYAQSNNYGSAGPLLGTAEAIRRKMIATAGHAGFKRCSEVG
jgi:hypothetical protein